MADDDRALMERLAALEAEVKADADAQRSIKDAAMAKVREQRAAQAAERAEMSAREVALVKRKRPAAAAIDDDDDDDASSSRSRSRDLGGALELASKANRVHKELAKTPGQGEKSWVKSGLASLVLGPFGWLYAGSLREAIPASVGWLALATLASKILPAFLLMPIMFVVMPLSAIAGIVYAMQFNRTGKRQRLFDKDGKDKDKKRLAP